VRDPILTLQIADLESAAE